MRGGTTLLLERGLFLCSERRPAGTVLCCVWWNCFIGFFWRKRRCQISGTISRFPRQCSTPAYDTFSRASSPSKNKEKLLPRPLHPPPPHADPPPRTHRSKTQVSRRAKIRGLPQLGTLGAGNHYAEIQVVEEIFDQQAAKKMGIDSVDQVRRLFIGSPRLFPFFFFSRRRLFHCMGQPGASLGCALTRVFASDGRAVYALETYLCFRQDPGLDAFLTFVGNNKRRSVKMLHSTGMLPCGVVETRGCPARTGRALLREARGGVRTIEPSLPPPAATEFYMYAAVTLRESVSALPSSTGLRTKYSKETVFPGVLYVLLLFVDVTAPGLYNDPQRKPRAGTPGCHRRARADGGGHGEGPDRHQRPTAGVRQNQ